MRKIFGCLALATLAGCATTIEEVTERDPEFTAITNKTTGAYAQCLKAEWLSFGATFERTNAHGIQVFFSPNGWVGATASIEAEGTVTSVKFYNPSNITQAKFADAARKCL